MKCLFDPFRIGRFLWDCIMVSWIVIRGYCKSGVYAWGFDALLPSRGWILFNSID